jgi:hypothetical protein
LIQEVEGGEADTAQQTPKSPQTPEVPLIEEVSGSGEGEKVERPQAPANTVIIQTRDGAVELEKATVDDRKFRHFISSPFVKRTYFTKVNDFG